MRDGLPTELSDLMSGTTAERVAAFEAGHPVDPADLAGAAYLGVSIGLPRWVDRLAWKTFVKAFAADPDVPGSTRGWNVRMVQDGLQGPHRPMLTASGQPKTFGFFRAVPLPDRKVRGLGPGHTLLDYGVPLNPVIDPTRAVRDPLVSLRPGTSDVLLGRTYLSMPGGWWATPSWFMLLHRPELTGLVSG